MQIQINKFLVLLMTIVLLSAGGCATDTSQNNGTPNSTQNLSNQNASNDNNPSQKSFAKKPCSNDVGQDIKDAIESDLPNLKDQFKEFNSSGAATASFSYANQELVFKGLIKSNEDDFSNFFRRFDRLRHKDCVKKISFQGETPTTNFEWNLQPTKPTPAFCSVDFKDALKKSNLNDQHTKNFDYLIAPPKVLNFNGYIIDSDGNEHLKKFFGELKDPLANGCISKIVFGAHGQTVPVTMSEQGFSWTICPGSQVECYGECVPFPCAKKENSNTTTNRNTNTNTNSNTNK